MSQLFNRLIIALLFAACAASAQAGLVISEMTFGSTYSSRFTGGGGVRDLRLLEKAEVYTLNDGSTWNSGAGTISYNYANLDYYFTSGSLISYVLDVGIGETVYDQTDYDSGDHSSRGQLGTTDLFVLHATKGGTTALVTGWLKVLSNTETWYGEPRFNYFAAEVGQLVPFRASYELLRGSVWDEYTFDRPFEYRVSGAVDFANVPAPASIPLIAVGLASLIWSRRKARYEIVSPSH